MFQENLTWRTFADPGGINAKWNAGSPTYYIIDPKGVIRYKWAGSPAAKNIDAALDRLIEEAGKDQPPQALPKPLVDAWKEAGAEVC